MKLIRFAAILVAVCVCLTVGPDAVLAQTMDFTIEKDDVQIGRKHYSPFVNRGYPDRVFWGDTHLHTAYSTDAGMVGCTLDPDEAYRFARGEKVVASTGQPAQLIRPLDFLVVADHSENLGLAPMIAESNPELLKTEFGRKIHRLVKSGKALEAFALWADGMTARKDPLKNDNIMRSMWERLLSSAERFNEPGRFTSLIGFEWTSIYKANNLHRVVIFRDDDQKAGQILPLSNYDTYDPEDLWTFMENYEKKTGGQILAIPHNGNLSNGLMFSVKTVSGKQINKAYAERRMHWEPLYEVTQIKGDGEAHPFLSPNDEFADYGTWDKGNFGLAAKEKQMLQYEYGRSALKLGLQLEAKIGANPFKFGMIGSTDSHTAFATAREDNFFGKASLGEPGQKGRFEDPVIQDLREDGDGSIVIQHWEAIASGLAAVWAKENTREALFDAMKRKEVYATTGSRPIVRVFAGWDFKADEVLRPDFLDQGYTRGVPMGGDLFKAPKGESPKFMVRALRDPEGGNLDRVQIIKGWLDSKGKLHERVYDIAVSDGRTIGKDGRCKTIVGNTVDVKNATYTNTIGDPLLTAFWKDPDFNSKHRAFYYIRVIEIPTPTWLAYDAKFYGVKLPDQYPMYTQERAYTSPIWYTP
jgi:hypothetical protein